MAAPLAYVSTLERLRLERGLSRKQVQREVPINRRSLMRAEDATGEPGFEVIRRLATFYDVRPDWLLGEIRRDLIEARGRVA